MLGREAGAQDGAEGGQHLELLGAEARFHALDEDVDGRAGVGRRSGDIGELLDHAGQLLHPERVAVDRPAGVDGSGALVPVQLPAQPPLEKGDRLLVPEPPNGEGLSLPPEAPALRGQEERGLGKGVQKGLEVGAPKATSSRTTSPVTSARRWRSSPSGGLNGTGVS